MSEFDLDIRVTTSSPSGAEPMWTLKIDTCTNVTCDTCTCSIGGTCDSCYTCQTICVCSQPGWTCHGAAAGEGAPLC